MPGASTISRGNLSLDMNLQASITPPATVTTATQTQTTTTVKGLLVGDLISWNQTSFNNVLISVTNMFVSAADTLTSRWTSEGATQSGAAAEVFILSVSRVENISAGGVAAFPTQIV